MSISLMCVIQVLFCSRDYCPYTHHYYRYVFIFSNIFPLMV